MRKRNLKTLRTNEMARALQSTLIYTEYKLNKGGKN
jgi:hypothetical protein